MVQSMWACLALLAAGLVMSSALPARILLPFNFEYDAEPSWSLDTYGDPAGLTDVASKSLGLHQPPRPDAAAASKLLEPAQGLDSSNSMQQPARAFGAHSNVEEEMLGAVDYLPNIHKLRPSKRYLGIELPDYIASKKELGKLKERMLNSGK
ncbi:uncharacterized protein LOC122248942 [Penaeus japonicus]|uniref:uncharacterized protein LOC122248942 n=1 Tax=Penaeus japonicus TaxID=27405 RepID=UPI001C710ADE|nr:uncharacterized protein LOC122248942 [Penaeus japonicus]